MKNTFENYSERGGFLWVSKNNYFPIIVVCENKWYPLISDYEDEKMLFDMPYYKLLKTNYESFGIINNMLNYLFSLFFWSIFNHFLILHNFQIYL